MKAGTNGLPDPTKITTFVAGAANPVELEIGPGGDLFYVDFEGGTIHRVTFGGHIPGTGRRHQRDADIRPLAAAGLVRRDGVDATRRAHALTYAWDLDGDGQFDDSTAATPTFTYATPGTRHVGLRVTDPSLATGTTTQDIVVDDTLPTPVIDSPASSLTWKVGDPISFSGHAPDGQGATLPASALSWSLDHPALPVELPHPYGPDVDRRRERDVRPRPTTTTRRTSSWS